jgi:hypothetical protein
MPKKNSPTEQARVIGNCRLDVDNSGEEPIVRLRHQETGAILVDDMLTAPNLVLNLSKLERERLGEFYPLRGENNHIESAAKVIKDLLCDFCRRYANMAPALTETDRLLAWAKQLKVSGQIQLREDLGGLWIKRFDLYRLLAMDEPSKLTSRETRQALANFCAGVERGMLPTGRYPSPEAYQFAARRVEEIKPLERLDDFLVLLDEWEKQINIGGAPEDEIELPAKQEHVYIRLKDRFSEMSGAPCRSLPKDTYQVPPPDSPIWGDVSPADRFHGEERRWLLADLWKAIYFDDEAKWLSRQADPSLNDILTREQYREMIEASMERLRVELIRLGHGDLWRNDEDTIPTDADQIKRFKWKVVRKVAEIKRRITTGIPPDAGDSVLERRMKRLEDALANLPPEWPSQSDAMEEERRAKEDSKPRGLLVSEVADKLILTLGWTSERREYAIQRVSKSCANNQLKSTGKGKNKRRIDPESAGEWLLKQAEREA